MNGCTLPMAMLTPYDFKYARANAIREIEFLNPLPSLHKRDHLAHDVFISHASLDKTVADAVCATLEHEGIRCWIAPRDILPGADWGQSIVSGIKASRAMVLVFSAAANASRHVPREVERSLAQGCPVIPFRIEDVVPQGGLEYHLGTVHWLDAMSPPLDAHLARLVEILKATLREPVIAADSSRREPIPAAAEPIKLETKPVALAEPLTLEAKPVAPREPLTPETKPVTPAQSEIQQSVPRSGPQVGLGQATVPENSVLSGKRFANYRELFDPARYGTNWLLIPAMIAATLPIALMSLMNGGVGAAWLSGTLLLAAVKAGVFTFAVHRLSILPAVVVISFEGVLAYLVSMAVTLANMTTGPTLAEIITPAFLAALISSIAIAGAMQLVGMNRVLRRVGLKPVALALVTALANAAGYVCYEAVQAVAGHSASITGVFTPAIQGAFTGFGIWIACRIFLRGKATFAGMEIRQ